MEEASKRQTRAEEAEGDSVETVAQNVQTAFSAATSALAQALQKSEAALRQGVAGKSAAVGFTQGASASALVQTAQEVSVPAERAGGADDTSAKVTGQPRGFAAHLAAHGARSMLPT